MMAAIWHSARKAWFEGQLDLDPERPIFIDETGTSTKMARLYGRAPRDQRCRAAVPHGHWKSTTFTAGLRLSGLAAPMILDGLMDGAAFRAHVEHVLVPELAPGCVVVMDNLPAHRVGGVPIICASVLGACDFPTFAPRPIGRAAGVARDNGRASVSRPLRATASRARAAQPR